MWITKTVNPTKNDRAWPSEKPLEKSKIAPDGGRGFGNNGTNNSVKGLMVEL